MIKRLIATAVLVTATSLSSAIGLEVSGGANTNQLSPVGSIGVYV